MKRLLGLRTPPGSQERVQLYIEHLRKELEDDPGMPHPIETVRELGYRYRPSAP